MEVAENKSKNVVYCVLDALYSVTYMTIPIYV